MSARVAAADRSARAAAKTSPTVATVAAALDPSPSFSPLGARKAVVSTTVGAEGLPLISGTHFLRVDDPADFAAAIVALLRDPARRRALGSAGRRLVEERYSWSQVTREFEALCEEEVRRHAC